MKRLIVGLGTLILVLAVALLTFEGFGYFQAKKLMPSIERFVDNFYQYCQRRDYAMIYSNLASESFRQAGSREDFNKLMTGIQERLGQVQSRTKKTLDISYAADGVLADIQYETVRENGTSTDKFLLQQIGQAWLLSGYNVQSPHLWQQEQDEHHEHHEAAH